MKPSATAVLAAVLAFTGVASAVPTNSMTGATFSVHQERNANFAGRSGPLALAKAYLKHHKPLSSDLKAALDRILASLEKRSTGTEPALPTQYDEEYLCQVKIGTPAQTLPLDFDTGSSDLWVFSSETSGSSGQKLYTPSKSSTSKKLSGATWSISYGDGSSSSGDVFTDTVNIGGLTVTGQAVESAKKVSSVFSSDSAVSGLLGLAFSSINTVTPRQQKTFFDNAISTLDQPLFTADLKHNAAGTYNFGFIDTTKYTGKITYTAVDNSQGFWGWTSTGYAIGGSTLRKSSISGIADTGTTLLLLPDAVVEAYYNNVDGADYDSDQGGYTFPCDATLPSFGFGVGTSTITIPGSIMNYAPVDDSGESCFGGLQSDGGDISIFGDIALKAAFVVFDGGNLRLGWAPKQV